MKWINVHATPESSTKHYQNIITILNGLSTLSRKLSKLPKFNAEAVIAKLTLKIVEFQYLKNGKITTSSSNLKYDNIPGLQPFYEDLTKTVPELHNLSDVTWNSDDSPSLSKSELINLLQGISNNQSDLDTFNKAIIGCQIRDLFTEPSFLSACLGVLEQIDHDKYNDFISSVVTYMKNNYKSLKSLSSQCFELLDSITVHLKNLSDRSESIPFTLHIIAQLHFLFSKFKQYKRIRNLSNLLYNLAAKMPFSPMTVLCIEACIDYEYEIYNKSNSGSQDRDILQSKVEKTSQMLMEHGKVGESGSMVIVFLSTIQGSIRTIDDKNLLNSRPLAHLILGLVDLIPNFTVSLFGESSELSELFITALCINLFEHIQSSSVNQEVVANDIMTSIHLNDETLRLICLYYYYTIQELDSYLDISLANPREPFHYLIISGIQLHKTINIEWSEESIDQSIELFNQYCFLESNPNEYEIEILSCLVNYLKFNKLHKKLHQLLSPYLCSRDLTGNFQLQCFRFYLLLDLVTVSIYLENYQEAHSLLDSSGMLLKEIFAAGRTSSALSARGLAAWKLLQVQSYIEQRDLVLADNKYEMLLKFVKSKTEFNLSYHSASLGISEKLKNLLLVVNLNFTASELRSRQGRYTASYQNLKTGSKLLLSIIKKITVDVPVKDRVALRWQSASLMSSFCISMIKTSKLLGISREISHYIAELKKLNECNKFPLVNGINHFYLSDNFLLLERNETALSELKKGNQITSLNIDDSLSLLSVSSNLLYYLVEKSDEHIKAFSARQRELVQTLSLPGESFNTVSPFKELIHESQLHLSMFHSSIEPTYQASELDAVRVDVGQIMNSLVNIPAFSSILNSVFSSPCLVDNMVNESQHIRQITDALAEANTKLLSVISNHSFPVHALRNISNQMAHITSVVNSISPISETQRYEIYYLHDFIRSLPIKHERHMREESAAEPEDIFPLSGLKFEHKYDFLGFSEDVKNLLPANWTIITLDIDSGSDELVLARLSKESDYKPICLRLPLKRMMDHGSTASSLSFTGALDKLNAIIKRSDDSIKPQTTSKIRTKEDRTNWWRLRFSLDMKLKEVLELIEYQWLGAFRGIFGNHDEESIQFQNFSNKFHELLYKYLPSFPRDTQLNTQIVGIISQLHLSIGTDADSVEIEKAIVADLIYFIMDSLMYLGEENAYDEVNVDMFHHEFVELMNEFEDKASNPGEHIVLIPGPTCHSIPWESLGCLSDKSVSRMPSIDLLLETLKKNPTFTKQKEKSWNTMYLLNPGGDLVKSEARFSELFESMSSWEGIVGRSPSDNNKFLLDILKKDLFVYVGHGGCEQYIKASSLFKFTNSRKELPPSLLFGCSSGHITTNGMLEPHGNVLNWLTCGSPMVLANLWDVTDKDIDKFTMGVFKLTSLCGEGSSLTVTESVKEGRKYCNLKYLNGSAPIVYGLPLKF
ncbi:separin protein [Yamadazyma tenuis]|nr:separin protein [Yamadazyma tenuis]